MILTVAQNPVRAEDQLNAADYELDSFKGYYNVEKSAGASPNLIEVLGGTPQVSTSTSCRWYTALQGLSNPST